MLNMRKKTAAYIRSVVMKSVVRLKGFRIETFAFTGTDLRLVADINGPVGVGVLVKIFNAFSRLEQID